MIILLNLWFSRILQGEPIQGKGRLSVLQTLGLGSSMGIAFVLVSIASDPRMIFVCVLGFAVCALAFFSPSVALMMVVAVVPLERVGRLTEDAAIYTISIMRLVGMLALVSLLFHGLIRNWKFHFGAPLLLYASYFVCCLASLLYTLEYKESLRTIGMIAGNLLFLFMVVNAVRNWRMVKMAIAFWLLATVLVALYTAYDWHFGRPIEESDIGIRATRSNTAYVDGSEYEALRAVKRAMGPTSSPGVYGINLIMTIPFFFLVIRLQQTAMRKLAIWACFGAVLYNLLLANTRATLIVGLFTIALCWLFKLFRISLNGAILLGGVLLLLMLFVPPEIYWRVLNPYNYTLKQSKTFSARLQYWSAALELAKKNWLWGIGIGNRGAIAEKVHLKNAPAQTAVHNEFVATFLELGLMGCIFFYGFLGSIIWIIRRMAVRYRHNPESIRYYMFCNASMVMTLSVLVYGLQVDVFHMPLKGWWLVVGLCLAMARLPRVNEAQLRSR